MINHTFFTRTKHFLHNSIHVRDYPYARLMPFKYPHNLSDLFVLPRDISKTLFIAENPYANLIAKPFCVSHNFHFFDNTGKLSSKYSYVSSSFSERIPLNAPINNSSYCSFTHHVKPLDLSHDDYVKEVLKTEIDVTFNHRGYTVYYSSPSDSIGLTVHGNFGSVPENLELLARQRQPCVYTPVYRFSDNYCYHLVFSNPTPKDLTITIHSSSVSKPITFSLSPLATHAYTLTGHEGLLSIESALPVCRPVVFVYDQHSENNLLDVFHG